MSGYLVKTTNEAVGYGVVGQRCAEWEAPPPPFPFEPLPPPVDPPPPGGGGDGVPCFVYYCIGSIYVPWGCTPIRKCPPGMDDIGDDGIVWPPW